MYRASLFVLFFIYYNQQMHNNNNNNNNNNKLPERWFYTQLPQDT
jgi:hypothetical protein